ncbi:unnamed protein product [Closterium sp. Naga37s-1]|nr:unnamed protein product [Closterium sp. Naga37s-1]
MAQEASDARGPSTTVAKDPELDLLYHEDSIQESSKESPVQTKAVQFMSRDSDEEDEWAELAMTVKLCLATAAPSEKLLEEHVKLARTQILPEMVAGDLPTPVAAAPTNLPLATTAELVAAAAMKAADALPGFLAMPVAAGVANDTCQNGEKGLGKAGSNKVPRVVTDSLAEMSQLQLLASKEVLKCCHYHNLAHQKNTNVPSAAAGATGAAGVVGFAVDDWKPPAVATKRRPACREGCLSLCMRLQEGEEGEVY